MAIAQFIGRRTSPLSGHASTNSRPPLAYFCLPLKASVRPTQKLLVETKLTGGLLVATVKRAV
jgi:hypothetical protein